MYCLDLDEEAQTTMYGSNYMGFSLDFILAPCNYVHKEFKNYEGLPIDDQCIFDKEEQFEYLTSAIYLKFLYNAESFAP